MKASASCVPVGVFGLVLSLLFGGTTAVHAQSGVPGLPSPAEIERRIDEAMDKLPVMRVEDEVFEIAYKPVPLDPEAVIEQAIANGANLPQGVNPKQAAKQLMPMAKPYIERAYGEIGTLKLLAPVKYKSVKIPAGEYVFGLVMKGQTPIGLRFAGAKLRRELRIPFRAARAKKSRPDLKLEIEVGDQRRGKRYIVAYFNDVKARAGKFTPQRKR